MRVLLEAGADMNAAATDDGATALHVLARAAPTEAWSEALRRLLLEHGVRLDLSDRCGQVRGIIRRTHHNSNNKNNSL
ncbi:hypothetical protein T492DRAFT_1055134 [Pavlovales sp. CCMP2436]|nr:hypothetical protein T492DRAFT_1055134 [Pavlovales sp. CCMP2436]